jgi:hypothetical protein
MKRVIMNSDLDLLFGQYKILAEDIRQIESSNEKVLSLGVTIVSVSIVYSLKEGLGEVLFIAPIGYIGVLLFVSHQYHHLFWRGGHKRAIEERLADVYGLNTLCWEKLITEQRSRFNFGNAMFGLFILVSLVAISVFCSYSVYNKYGLLECTALTLLIIWLFCSLVLNIIDARRSFDVSYAESKILFNQSN